MIELLKSNLNELNRGLYLGLEIDFKGGFIIVLDDNKKIIFRDKMLNYDVSFESQKRFILNVASKLFKFVRDDETLEYDKIENINDLKLAVNNKFINIDKAIVIVKYIDNNKHLENMVNIYYANIDKEEADKYIKFINGAMYI